MAEEGTRPLYDRIKQDLRAAVARRDYEPGQPFVTQREVCERYAVSTTTAVRALNELVTEGVLVRHRGKGTFVAETQPRARGGHDGTVSCIIHGLPGPHTAEIVRAVESVCTDLGYRMFLADSDRSVEREERALRQALEAGSAGVILYPVEGQANAHVLEEFRKRQIPVVLVDRYLTDFASEAVLADNFRIGYELTTTLLDRGHERIGTLWSETQCTSAQARLTGHIRALRERSIPVLPELTMLRSYWPGSEEVRAKILSNTLGSATKPTALLCANGYVLAAAANDLLKIGVDVPRDIDLASMDDAGPYDILPLAAVTATLPSHEMGRLAMRRLADRIDSDDPYGDTQHVTLPVEFHSREGVPTYLDTLGAAGRSLPLQVTEQQR